MEWGLSGLGWFPLALLCALSLASADAATKAWLQGLSARELVVVRFGLTGILLLPVLLVQSWPEDLPWAFWGLLLVLVPLELTAMGLYMRAIRDYPLSQTLPYLAFSPVLVVLIAHLVLGERVSVQGFAGILLVVLGTWLLNSHHANPRAWRSWGAPLGAIRHQTGARLMLGVAALYGLTSTLGKAAMQYLGPQRFGAFYFGVLGLTSLITLALPRPGTLLRIACRPWAALTVALSTALMVYTHFLAISQVEVAYMIAVKRTSLLFGILYGALLFHEQDLSRNLIAGGIMLVGVGLILL